MPSWLLDRSANHWSRHTEWISDQYWQLVTGEVRRRDSGPVALHTSLGWVLSGPVESSTSDNDPSVNLVSSTHVLRCATESSHPQNSDLIGELKRFWDLESLGISNSEQSVHWDNLLSTWEIWSASAMEGHSPSSTRQLWDKPQTFNESVESPKTIKRQSA